MTLFILGLIIFFGMHFYTALARGSRERLVARVGACPYRGLCSLASIAGFALIVLGWPGADATVLYSPPAWTRHIAHLLMLVALILLAAAYTPKGKIAAAVKHPMSPASRRGHSRIFSSMATCGRSCCSAPSSAMA